MRNDYQYIDHDYIYTDPKTGVLRNLGGIADQGNRIKIFSWLQLYGHGVPCPIASSGYHC
ncbi:MAG: hypothetical protein LBB91_06165 [Clostridiales bacterium]|jgi:hypothetical protein|nr:hypothetical protein [Clostridiales bacterium]